MDSYCFCVCMLRGNKNSIFNQKSNKKRQSFCGQFQVIIWCYARIIGYSWFLPTKSELYSMEITSRKLAHFSEAFLILAVRGTKNLRCIWSWISLLLKQCCVTLLQTLSHLQQLHREQSSHIGSQTRCFFWPQWGPPLGPCSAISARRLLLP